MSLPFRDTISDFHHPLAIKDMCSGLEIERDFVIFKLEATGVREDGTSALIKQRRPTSIAGDLAWHIMDRFGIDALG